MSVFPKTFPRRGEIYMVDFNPARGSEQAGVRPAVVVSNDVNNQYSPVVVVAAMTRTKQKAKYPQNVTVPAGILEDGGTILGNQLYTIDKTRLERFRGELDPALVEELNRALAVGLGLPH